MANSGMLKDARLLPGFWALGLVGFGLAVHGRNLELACCLPDGIGVLALIGASNGARLPNLQE